MIDSEKDVDRLLSVQLKKHGIVYKIENTAMVGMADFYFANHRKIVWIENKVINSVLSPVKFRSGQVPFLYNNWGVAETFILVYNKNNNSYYLFSGLDSKMLQDNKFELVIDRALFLNQKIKEVTKWIVNFKKK
jgi:hypothetical protein